MPDIVCLGEALIDFVSLESGVSLIETPGFEKAAGGAPANVAVGLARLGVSAGFIGKVGDDPFGRFLAQTIAAPGVDVSQLRFESEARTGLAFVSLTAAGERDFVFYRNPSADMLLRPDEIDEGYLAGARLFHYGSITLIVEPSRSATLKAIEAARRGGLIVSYDPNLRLSLWDTAEHARSEITAALDYAHIVKVSEEEVEFLFGHRDLDRGAEALLERPDVRLVVITRGEGGCYYRTRAESGAAAGLRPAVVDTTGAGDAFVAAMLRGVLATVRDGGWEALSGDRLRRIMIEANAAGALTTTKKGAIPALPTAAELDQFLAAFAGQ